MPEQSSILRRFVLHFAKRRIAGTTVSSALRAVKRLNEHKLHATVTFLSDVGSNAGKARYNVNAYAQLIRQISRLRLNADVSLRPAQIGEPNGSSNHSRGLGSIVDIARKNGVLVWLESESPDDVDNIAGVLRGNAGLLPNIGVEIPVQRCRGFDADALRGVDSIRLTSYGHGQQPATVRDYSFGINSLGRGKRITVLESDSKLIQSIARSKLGTRRGMTFEVPFGYSNRRLKRLMKLGRSTSVYVPYGKDWMHYAVERIVDGAAESGAGDDGER